MGWADGVEQSQGSDRGQFVQPGTYGVEVVQCRAGTKRAGGDFFVAKLKVLSSNNPSFRAGDEMDWYSNIDQIEDNRKLQLGDIRSFVAVAEGVSIDQVTAEVLYYVADERTGGKALAGKKLTLVATNITTKKGTPFTKCAFRPFEAQAQAAV